MTLTQTPGDVTGGATPPLTVAEILARARAIVPRLRERSAEIESERRLPADVVRLLRDTGVFQMGFGREWGGPELSSMEQTEVVEVLSYGDSSA